MKAVCDVNLFKRGLRFRAWHLAADAMFYMFAPDYVMNMIYGDCIVDNAHRAMVLSLGIFQLTTAMFLAHLSMQHPSMKMVRLVFIYTIGHAVVEYVQAARGLVVHSHTTMLMSTAFCGWALFMLLTARPRHPHGYNTSVATRPRRVVKEEALEEDGEVFSTDEEGAGSEADDDDDEEEVVQDVENDVDVDVEGSGVSSDDEDDGGDDDVDGLVVTDAAAASDEQDAVRITEEDQSSAMQRVRRTHAALPSPIASRTRRRR